MYGRFVSFWSYPPIWLDFVPTGAKERQGEGTFARDQRVKFQTPSITAGGGLEHRKSCKSTVQSAAAP